jgi:hypothetical protein
MEDERDRREIQRVGIKKPNIGAKLRASKSRHPAGDREPAVGCGRRVRPASRGSSQKEDKRGDT